MKIKFWINVLLFVVAIAFVVTSFFWYVARPGTKKLNADTTLAQGELLYKAYCTRCHQNNGNGVEGLYPPLASADYYTNNQDILACIIKNGQHEPISVNGKTFRGAMPANPQLTDLQIAQLISYINTQWNNLPKVSETQVKASLEKCN